MTAWANAAGGPYLPLYLVTLALHAAFVGYLVGGAAYVLVGSARARRRGADRPPLTAHIASWLPLTMGGAITAGVAPLLFLQLLHQRAFYTANLLMGPIWFVMIPALIVGFYALYLHKSRPALHPAIVLGTALVCFAAVAGLWSWNHRVMTQPAQWTAAYGTSAPAAYGLGWMARSPLWIGGMLAQFAIVALWQAVRLGEGRALQVVAAVALGGRALSALGAVLLGWHLALGDPFTLLLAITAVADGALWLALAARHRRRDAAASEVARRVSRVHLWLLTATSTLTLAFAVLVREQERLPQLLPLRASVQNAGGAWVFALFAVLAVVAFTLIFRSVGRALRHPAPARGAAGAAAVSDDPPAAAPTEAPG